MNDDNLYYEDDNKKSRCSDCRFYKMIDSGYGFCRRYPPQEVIHKKLFKKPIVLIEYPTVAWCQITCGEYKKNI